MDGSPLFEPWRDRLHRHMGRTQLTGKICEETKVDLVPAQVMGPDPDHRGELSPITAGTSTSRMGWNHPEKAGSRAHNSCFNVQKVNCSCRLNFEFVLSPNPKSLVVLGHSCVAMFYSVVCWGSQSSTMGIRPPSPGNLGMSGVP